MSANVVMFRAFLAIYCFAQMVNMSWFWMRRNYHPIPKRKPPLVLLEYALRTSVGVFLLVVAGFPEQLSISCSAAMMTYVILLFCNLGLNLIRSFLVFWWHIQTILKIKFASKLVDCGSLCKIDISQMNSSGDKLLCWEVNDIEKWIWKQRAWLNTNFWIGIASSVLIGATAISTSITLTLRTHDDDKLALFELKANSDLCQGLYMGIAFLISAVALLTWVFPASLIAFRLRNVKENFKLKEDISTLSVGYVLLSVLGIVWIHKDATRPVLVDPGYFYIFNGFVFPMIETLFRDFRLIYWTYQFQRDNRKLQTTESSNEDGGAEKHVKFRSELQYQEDMLNTMKNGEGALLFEEYLRAEFAIENLFFIQACQSFTRLFGREELSPEDRKKLRRVAVAIRDKFILDSSPLTVNLSYPIRKKIVDALSKYPASHQEDFPNFNSLNELPSQDLKNIPSSEGLEIDKVLVAETVDIKDDEILQLPGNQEGSRLEELTFDTHLFDGAYNEILRLMATDSYMRFIRTTEFKEWRLNHPQAQTVPSTVEAVPTQPNKVDR
jgi:hypothetical protein